LFFVIAALYDERLGSLLFRAQLAVIYLGAGLNKLLDADWRTGAFVQDWLRPDHYETGYIYTHFASLLPGTMLSALLSWTAILTEFVLIPLLLVPRFVPLAIFVGVSYHTGLVLITGGSTFGVFWYALVATYIALLQWPVRLVVNYNTQDRLQLELDMGTGMGIGRFTGVAAVTRILLYTPAFYIACLILFNMSPDIALITYALTFGIGYYYIPRIKAMKASLWRRATDRHGSAVVPPSRECAQSTSGSSQRSPYRPRSKAARTFEPTASGWKGEQVRKVGPHVEDPLQEHAPHGVGSLAPAVDPQRTHDHRGLRGGPDSS
jgi:hypothetical protein